MTSRKRDGKEMEEDWFEVMGLEWDVTADDVNKGKLSNLQVVELCNHPFQ